MQLKDKKLRLSATDLSNHLACSHLTQLELKKANGEIERPVRQNQFLERIIERGIEHEAAYVEYLRQNCNNRVVELTRDEPRATEKTICAMKKGTDVIVQGALADDQFGGRPDLLIKKNTPSPAFGKWSYEVADTKLTQTTKAGTILQLCVYSDLITAIQGKAPEQMHVVMPQENEAQPFHCESHRFDDYTAYYRLAKARLSDVITNEPDNNRLPGACQPL